SSRLFRNTFGCRSPPPLGPELSTISSAYAEPLITRPFVPLPTDGSASCSVAGRTVCLTTNLPINKACADVGRPLPDASPLDTRAQMSGSRRYFATRLAAAAKRDL